MPLYNQSAMQAHEDTLALLTGPPQKTSHRSMENLLSIYGALEGYDQSRESSHAIQRKTILEELSEILHLRGRLQQMGATFSDNGEILTYGNPSTPEDFDAMIRLGPLYDEQWNSFFNETYEQSNDRGPNAQLWASLRTLKKLLRNEGVVFGRQHQRYSFGDSSKRLRRLCCAYDELRNEWLTMLRARLPAHDDAQLATLLEGESSSDDDSGSSDENSQGTNGTEILDTDAPRDIIELPVVPHHRSSRVPRAIGWRFSDDSIPQSRKNAARRDSDDSSSVPGWRDIEQAHSHGLQDAPSVSITRNYSPKRINVLQEDSRQTPVSPSFTTNLMPPSMSPLQAERMAARTPRSRPITPLKNMNTQSSLHGDGIIANGGADREVSGDVAKAIPALETKEKHGKRKTLGRVRGWLRHPFGRKQYSLSLWNSSGVKKRT